MLKPDGSWEERYLCFAPQERLFLHGRWQEGIEPAVGLTAADREQFRRLAEITDGLRATGRFTVPLDARTVDRRTPRSIASRLPRG